MLTLEKTEFATRPVCMLSTVAHSLMEVIVSDEKRAHSFLFRVADSLGLSGLILTAAMIAGGGAAAAVAMPMSYPPVTTVVNYENSNYAAQQDTSASDNFHHFITQALYSFENFAIGSILVAVAKRVLLACLPVHRMIVSQDDNDLNKLESVTFGPEYAGELDVSEAEFIEKARAVEQELAASGVEHSNEKDMAVTGRFIIDSIAGKCRGFLCSDEAKSLISSPSDVANRIRTALFSGAQGGDLLAAVIAGTAQVIVKEGLDEFCRKH